MKKLRILIVEDDVMARMALETILTDIAPVAVIAQRSVRDATGILGERFDFAFLDRRMTKERFRGELVLVRIVFRTKPHAECRSISIAFEVRF